MSALDRGVIIGFDTFGLEYYMDSVFPFLGTSDKERGFALVELLKAGYEKQIVLSQDVCTKTRLKRYGGYGYGHLLKHVIPALKHLGANDKQINTMMIENPKRILSI